MIDGYSRDHPEVRAFIRNIFERFRAEGWKYFKIDFTYSVTAARVAYDRKKTVFQTLRDMNALFREAVGPDVFLNACIGSPSRYALGHVDITRLGGDIASCRLASRLMLLPTSRLSRRNVL